MKEKSHYHSGYGVQKKGKNLKIMDLFRYCRDIALFHWFDLFVLLEKSLFENQSSK